MPWHARLQLDYTAEHNARTVARYEHNGPLRILQSLYPEGDGAGVVFCRVVELKAGVPGHVVMGCYEMSS